MDLNSALDILIKDLSEAREIIDDLRHIKGVPLLQVELAKAKCRNAGEIIALLKSMNLGEVTATAEPQPAATVVTTPPEVKTPRPEPAAKPAPAPVAVPEPAAVTLPEPAVEKAPEPGIKPAPEPVKPAPSEPVPPPVAETPPDYHPAPKKSAKAARTILADKFTEPESRINEKIKGTRTDDDITARLKQSPITSLADAIGINDKFFFIREIFNGDAGAYSDAINRLNGVSSMGEADSIIAPFRTGETDPAAVSMLLDLVKRKTGING